MAKVTLSAGEVARTQTIARELDDAIEEFFADARSELSETQWDVLTGYARESIRRAIVIGALLHGVVDSQAGHSFPYRGRGREVFVREGIAAWRGSFAPIPEVWKLVSVFDVAPGGEQRVLADVATLEVMAANRMFASLDDQCAEFLASEERPN
ncbi:MAG TPA: hypothetical protein VJ927_10600 [Actinomycetota bacterium]|nr:hypothetical protein [Actinomycetota bacterium]